LGTYRRFAGGDGIVSTAIVYDARSQPSKKRVKRRTKQVYRNVCFNCAKIWDMTENQLRTRCADLATTFAS